MSRTFLWCLMILCVKNLNAVKNIDAKEDLTLDLVQVIFRHGLRTPSKQEAKFINVYNSSIYGLDFGQLTKQGMMQEYVLGQLLRKNYDTHVGAYQENKITARSTDSSRTKMSLELVLAGLFPPTSEEKWHPRLDWRPIPYKFATGVVDVVLAPYNSPKFFELYKREIENSPDYHARLSNYTELIEFLEKQTSRTYFDNIVFHGGWTSSAVKIHKLLNLTLPDWCSDEIYQKLDDLVSFLHDTYSLTKNLKKFNGGTLVRQVVENIQKNRNSEPKKIYLYSTHDITLAAFARAQNVIVGSFNLPPFGSAYIVESYKNSKSQSYVRMLSWDGASDQFVELEVLECGKYCSLDKYINFVKDVIPTDEELKLFYDDISASLMMFQ